MTSLDTPISLPAITQALTHAWSWWIGELAGSVPPSIRRRLMPPRPEFMIQFNGAQSIIFRVGERELVKVAELDPWKPTNVAIASAAQIITKDGNPRVSVRLSKTLALRRELNLPATAEPRLRQIVQLDLDRQTPFSSENSVFDVVVRERSKDTDRLRVALVVTKRDTVDAAMVLCRRLGVWPGSIGIAAPDEASGKFNLLPTEKGRIKLRLRSHPRLILAGALGLLFLINVGLAFWRIDTRLSDLTAELATVRKTSQATEKLRAQLTRSQSEARLLSDARNQFGPLEALLELTHIFSDDVWLFQLELNNDSVQIHGFAPSAADLIDRLDKSGKFANPRFRAPVTRTEKAGEDRFEISVDLRPQASR